MILDLSSDCTFTVDFVLMQLFFLLDTHHRGKSQRESVCVGDDGPALCSRRPKAYCRRVWWRGRCRGRAIEASAEGKMKIDSVGELRVRGLNNSHLCLDLSNLQLQQ